MVIVLHHTIAAAILFYRNPSKFKNEGVRQVALLKFCAASTLDELRTAILEVCQLVLPTAKDTVIFLPRSACDAGHIQNIIPDLPRKGIVWEAYQTRQRIVIKKIELSDPVCIHFTKGITSNSTVICSPVIDEYLHRAVGVLLISCDDLSGEDEDELQFIEQQIAVCFKRLKATELAMDANSQTRDQAILKLCAELYDQESSLLQLKVINYLKQQTNSQNAFLLMVASDTQELFCQVVGDRVLSEEIRFPGETSSFAIAMETKQPMTLDYISESNRKSIELFLGHTIESLLCVPITSPINEQLIALPCVINKLNSAGYTKDDVHIVRHCFQYTATVLTSTLAFQNERKLKNETQALLQVARNLFTHLDDLTKLLREIMQEARNLTAAERCSVFLIDRETDELIAKVFDGITSDESEIQAEIRLPITQGIAGHVAMRGELLNIKDAYSHPLFYRGIDDSTGFRTRNILCFPIKDEKGVVLGVAQLCNKKIGPCFTTFDEEIASAFAVYCCISISHSLMYKNVIEAQHRNSLANELMMYHMKVTNEDVNSLISSDTPNPHHFHPEFDNYTYPPRVLNDNDSILSCLSMFEDLGLAMRWRIKRETLGRFLLMVKRGYRNPPYHNWMHAFSVGHFCYLLNKNSLLLEYLDEIEIFALFVACLCHDIDHRGTNNSFQLESKSVLAALYSSEGSVMERHHFAQTMCIVNTDGCNIFESLSRKEYQQVLDLMRDIILATDLAHHLRILKSLQAMAEDGYDKTNYRHHKHLLCLMMTACDLSDQTKNWNNTKHIASLIYQEFFSQGDLEKEIGKKPMEMMDRERARIPDLQLSFLDHIALPVFRLLPKILTSTKYVQTVVEENRLHWQRISDHLKNKEGDTDKCITMDELLSLDGGAVENGEPTNGNVC